MIASGKHCWIICIVGESGAQWQCQLQMTFQPFHALTFLIAPNTTIVIIIKSTVVRELSAMNVVGNQEDEAMSAVCVCAPVLAAGFS